MTTKERHFEFMKAALAGLSVEVESSTYGPELTASHAREYADAALAEFNKRWPEEEK